MVPKSMLLLLAGARGGAFRDRLMVRLLEKSMRTWQSRRDVGGVDEAVGTSCVARRRRRGGACPATPPLPPLAAAVAPPAPASPPTISAPNASAASPRALVP